MLLQEEHVHKKNMISSAVGLWCLWILHPISSIGKFLSTWCKPLEHRDGKLSSSKRYPFLCFGGEYLSTYSVSCSPVDSIVPFTPLAG